MSEKKRMFELLKWRITYLWKRRKTDWKTYHQTVEAVSRDNAIMCGRYKLLAMLTSEGVFDPEVRFEQDFQLIQVAEAENF